MAARTKKGRRTTGHDAVATIRLSSELRESVDARPQRITWISDHRRKLLTDREPPFGLRENHHPTVRGDPSAIERSCDLLAGNGWKGERKKPIVGHGGCGSARSSESDGFSTQFLRSTNPLRHTHQHSNPYVMNKTG